MGNSRSKSEFDCAINTEFRRLLADFDDETVGVDPFQGAEEAREWLRIEGEYKRKLLAAISRIAASRPSDSRFEAHVTLARSRVHTAFRVQPRAYEISW